MSTAKATTYTGTGAEHAVQDQENAESMLVYMVRFLPRAAFRGLQWLQRPTGNPYLDHPLLEPVKREVFTNELEVDGEVPGDLDGVYIRTGPNPPHRPWGDYHWFDGDAMVHAVCFEGGKAKSYTNHWLRAFRHNVEQAAGCNLFLRLGDLKGFIGVVLLVLARVMRAVLAPLPAEGRLAAGPLGNTALTVHGGRVLALMEGGLPFALRLCAGAVRSLGTFTFGGGLTHEMSAHPKADPHTGELVSFAYELQPSPRQPHAVLYQTVSPSGVLSRDYPVDVTRPQMMHDFAITDAYAVFMDHALVFDPEAMVRGGGLPFVTDGGGASRIGLLRRAAPGAGVRWFEVPPFVCFHTATAWDDGDLVHLVLCKMDSIDLTLGGVDAAGNPTTEPGFATRLTIDTLSGEVTETRLVSDWALDFPVVPAASIARFTPYSYMVGEKLSPDTPDKVGLLCTAIVKVDLLAGEAEGAAGIAHLPEGMRCGEFSFVPRRGAAAADDGYLVGFATHATTLHSFCLVFCAKTMSSTPLATIRIPQRVPAGFHGMWVSKQQLSEQPDAPAKHVS